MKRGVKKREEEPKRPLLKTAIKFLLKIALTNKKVRIVVAGITTIIIVAIAILELKAGELTLSELLQILISV